MTDLKNPGSTRFTNQELDSIKLFIEKLNEAIVNDENLQKDEKRFYENRISTCKKSLSDMPRAGWKESFNAAIKSEPSLTISGGNTLIGKQYARSILDKHSNQFTDSDKEIINYILK